MEKTYHSSLFLLILFISLLLLILMVPQCVVANEVEQKNTQIEMLAPGYGELNFTAPEAGTYTLPVLGVASDATVLNTEGNKVRYYDLFNGKYTLLNFMYSRCGDINGCPLTHVVFNRIKHLVKKDAQLDKKIQLISMSFDVKNDTPEALRKLSQGHANHGAHGEHSNDKSWVYLTANSEEELYPILKNYNQSILEKYDDKGKPTGSFSHILRVYLIDKEKQIRNIYSVSFLHPDIIINDIKTLLISDGLLSEPPTKEKSSRTGPGDDKKGYDSVDYQTNSVSLLARKGKPTDLLKHVKNPPLGLPAVPIPESNALSIKKIQLGKKLFFDRRLSLNNTMSCAMCHIPEQGFTNNELRKPIGFEGRAIRRNAPTLYNIAYASALFHDARETTLENQIWGPLLASNEMAMPSIGFVIQKIKKLVDYQGLFEQAFNGREADVTTIGEAIASYERVLISGNSAFDRWYYGGEDDAISGRAKRGFDVFKNKARCVSCHLVNKESALFTDYQLHNTGIGWLQAMGDEKKDNSIQISPGLYIDSLDTVSQQLGMQSLNADLGYYEITQKPIDRWRYKTPSLRNVALTAPYMHDGSLNSLHEVVEFYNQGGIDNEEKSPLIKPLNLSKSEQDDLVEFLKTLTGSDVDELVLDAFWRHK